MITIGELIRNFVVLLITAAIILAFTSCHTSRTLTTSHVNTDSIATRIKDSFTRVTTMIEARYQQRIQELVNSSVVFETQPCPDEDSLLSLLDSVGKLNYHRILDSIGGFSAGVGNTGVGRRWANKVEVIGGNISASGRIKSVTVTTSKLLEENTSLSRRNDSLWAVIDQQKVELSRKVDVKAKEVTKGHALWYWMLTIVLGVICFVGGWWGRGRLGERQVSARGG
jgi:hypothetical protein